MPHLHGFKCAHRIEIPGAARFLTFSTFRQRPIFDACARRLCFTDSLRRYSESGQIELHAWTLMPDHCHLLLTPLEPALSPSLHAFKCEVTRMLGATDPSLGRVWRPGGGHDRTIYTFGEFHQKVDYIHANAVRGRLAADRRDWPWHSWHERHDEPRPEMPRIHPMSPTRLLEAKDAWNARRC
jgi:putative transposase